MQFLETKHKTTYVTFFHTVECKIKLNFMEKNFGIQVLASQLQNNSAF